MTPTKHEKRKVTQKICRRLREARSEICGFNPDEGAHLLGVTRDELTAIEQSVEDAPAPWVVLRAAERYAVSIDWLYGLSPDDWELCLEARRERDVYVSLVRQHMEGLAETVNESRKLHNKISACVLAVETLPAGVESIKVALDRFMELNPEFQDMAAGSPLLSSVERAQLAAQVAMSAMRRFAKTQAVEPTIFDRHSPATEAQADDAE
ncbi:MAG: hypothetical protein PHE55_00870 [Methylococcaceae bacterium]|nr:hypothetical protein [Methylococcaceae bacterium]